MDGFHVGRGSRYGPVGRFGAFSVFWCLTSVGLHNLLLHYADRPAARRAAWTKFVVSRLGDVAVLSAICLYYPLVDSLQFSDLAAAALDSATAQNPSFQLATCLLAVGVLTKSAQLPFHTWLPLTMETPTPVSALMHAGIVNAGGYLLVRSSPLLTSSIAAQAIVILFGTLTACLASVIIDYSDQRQEEAGLFDHLANGFHVDAMWLGGLLGGHAAYRGSFAV